jgi:predicted O-methyltransferase YrrM
MINHIPEITDNPKVVNVVSAWQPLSGFILDILQRFKIKRSTALEFGVERGYSTTALSNYFEKVIGVDRWDWIIPDGIDRTFESIKESLKDFKNIELIRSSFEDYIKNNNKRFDLIHVDVGYDTHAYETTYPCGEWAVIHSDCVLFHDTLSFPEISRVCEELAEKYGFKFYNISEDIGPAGLVCGLGILIKIK